MPILLHERINSIAVLRLNRPEKLNALSAELFNELIQELERLQADDTLRVLILTGTGQAFSTGTDISELVDSTANDAWGISARGQQLCDQLEHFPVPTIAAINGIAAGGGCEIALACHLRIASSLARFSLPEAKLGLLPGYGGTQRLRRLVGTGRALELMLTGREIAAQEAFEIGLINRLVPQADLVEEALALARAIEQLAPLAIRACLKAVLLGLEQPLADGLALESELFASLFATEDVREGTSAFLEKRLPVFKGK
jgi:enoyl-CoA hydratase/carnithine racemase